MPLPQTEFDRMAAELEAMARRIKEFPELNHHFAERLELLARQMRDDQKRLGAAANPS